TGTGHFLNTGAPDIPNSPSLNDVLAGDVDGDGDLDLVTSVGSVRLNNGNGTFGPFSSLGNSFDGRSSIALADVDSNGTLDVLASSGEVMLGSGTGTFASAPNFAPFTYDIRDLATGDFDGDGDVDMVYP
ncbi:FG-GAP repeat domain-containing protein, partial [Myxococcus xanthus]